MIDTLSGIQNSAIYILIIASFLLLYLYVRVRTKRTHSSDVEKSFINSKEKFLVFKPQLGLRNLDPLYGYFHLKGWDEWNFNKKDMERRFEAIKGICNECNKNQAQVGYYEEGYMKGFQNHNEWIIPQKPPTLLCKQCAFRKLKSILFTSKEKFSKGITPPYGGNGIYISTTTEK